MKKIFAILALVGAVAVGSAQNVAKPGLYDKYGNVVVAEDAPVVVSVTLRSVTEHFEPGVYARYAQKYLGKRATLSEYTTIELIDGRLALGEAKKVAPKVEQAPAALPLPLNKMSAAAQTGNFPMMYLADKPSCARMKRTENVSILRPFCLCIDIVRWICYTKLEM